MSQSAADVVNLSTVRPDNAADSERFLYDTLRVVDRVNQALGHHDLSVAALKAEAADLVALQQLALVYAKQALDKADWINLHRYVAQLAVAEGAQSAWQWQAMDLMSFALSDYLADRPDAGDARLHALVAITRQGAADRLHDLYRRAQVNVYNDVRQGLEGNNTLDGLCQTVIAQRRHA